MKALDNKIYLEIQNLPEEMKQWVLAYIQGIKTKTKTTPKKTQKGKIDSKPGHGGAKNLLKYIPPGLEKISVAEDFEEYH